MKYKDPSWSKSPFRQASPPPFNQILNYFYRDKSKHAGLSIRIDIRSMDSILCCNYTYWGWPIYTEHVAGDSAINQYWEYIECFGQHHRAVPFKNLKETAGFSRDMVEIDSPPPPNHPLFYASQSDCCVFYFIFIKFKHDKTRTGFYILFAWI